MINTGVLIENIKDWAENLSWTSVDGGGTTSFQYVDTAPIYNQINGSPAFVVYLDSQTASTETSTSIGSVRFINLVHLEVVVNFATSGADVNSARREAVLRLNEASDYIRSQISKNNIINTWQTSPTEARADVSTVNFRSEDLTSQLLVNIEENVLIRRFVYPISDVVENT